MSMAKVCQFVFIVLRFMLRLLFCFYFAHVLISKYRLVYSRVEMYSLIRLERPCVNSLRPDGTFVRESMWSSLVQVMACRRPASSNYLEQCWRIVKWTTRNKLQWNLNQNTNNFFEHAFEKVVCAMTAILTKHKCDHKKTSRFFNASSHHQKQCVKSRSGVTKTAENGWRFTRCRSIVMVLIADWSP